MSLRRLLLLLFVTAFATPGAEPDAKTIIQNSVEANNRDFAAAPRFNHKEKDRTTDAKTYQITMIAGSPYRRLLEVNGKVLSAGQQRSEQAKEDRERKKRGAESASDRRQRIAKFEKGRHRDNVMMSQLTRAFDFTIIGRDTLRGFHVYVLKATPRPDYNPPNMESEVLPGMQGQLWIDEKTFQWVKVTAKVIRPVSIAGFLAQVEPGTEFELEKAPVGDGSIWFVSRFQMRANAKVLFMINHNSEEEDTFWDYQPVR